MFCSGYCELMYVIIVYQEGCNFVKGYKINKFLNMAEVQENGVGLSWADIMNYMKSQFDEIINSQKK